MTINMSKRLRKKKHLGEFVEYGFAVHYSLNIEDIDDDVGIQLLEFINSRDLAMLNEQDGDVYVSKIDPGSTTEEDREAVDSWLSSHKDLSSYHVDALSDGWHPKRVIRVNRSGFGRTIYQINPRKTV